MSNAIPNNIVESVSSLLQPYGVNFQEMLKESKDNHGKIERKYITPEQGHVYCGFSAKTLRDKALAGEIESIRAGRSKKSRVLLKFKSLQSWLESLSQINQ